MKDGLESLRRFEVWRLADQVARPTLARGEEDAVASHDSQNAPTRYAGLGCAYCKLAS